MFGVDLLPWFVGGLGIGSGFAAVLGAIVAIAIKFGPPEAPDNRDRLARYIVQQAMKQRLSEDNIQWCLNELSKELPFPAVTTDADVQPTAEQWFTAWFEYNRDQFETPALKESRPNSGW
jgi:hypothetical protein